MTETAKRFEHVQRALDKSLDQILEWENENLGEKKLRKSIVDFKSFILKVWRGSNHDLLVPQIKKLQTALQGAYRDKQYEAAQAKLLCSLQFLTFCTPANQTDSDKRLLCPVTKNPIYNYRAYLTSSGVWIPYTQLKTLDAKVLKCISDDELTEAEIASIALYLIAEKHKAENKILNLMTHTLAYTGLAIAFIMHYNISTIDKCVMADEYRRGNGFLNFMFHITFLTRAVCWLLSVFPMFSARECACTFNNLLDVSSMLGYIPATGALMVAYYYLAANLKNYVEANNQVELERSVYNKMPDDVLKSAEQFGGINKYKAEINEIVMQIRQALKIPERPANIYR